MSVVTNASKLMPIVLHSTTIAASALAVGEIRDQWALIAYDLLNLFMDILMINAYNSIIHRLGSGSCSRSFGLVRNLNCFGS